jgi:hypothetical protein
MAALRVVPVALEPPVSVMPVPPGMPASVLVP